MTEPIDYHPLLLKCLSHIAATKGSTFLTGLLPGDEDLTEEELVELRRLSGDTLRAKYEKMHARLLEMQVEIEELKRKNGDASSWPIHTGHLAIDRLIDQAPRKVRRRAMPNARNDPCAAVGLRRPARVSPEKGLRSPTAAVCAISARPTGKSLA
jgi:hypothetical protein